MSVEFVADIGANDDGSLDRALSLIRLAAASGATVVKWQHFRAEHIVSPEGFAALGKMAHQAAWSESVVDVYRKAEVPWAWTPLLAAQCEVCGVEFMSTAYDLEAVDHLNPFVKRWKIGSGDITYKALLQKVAGTGKPVLLGTGASTEKEAHEAWEVLRDAGENRVVALQCNTDYSGGSISHTNLRALSRSHPFAFLHNGLSDHTRSLPVVLGAVALGASVIERHFTDDHTRHGPDHAFAMNPEEWRDMVRAVRELESAMGDGVKKVEPNEVKSRIVQRRAWYVTRDMDTLDVLRERDVIALRPCPDGAVTPMTDVVGRRIKNIVAKGTVLFASMLA